MSASLKIYLLCNRPRVVLDDEEIDIADSSLDLLIYLVVERKASHDREELAQTLYGSSAFKENLRKTAYHYLPKEVKDIIGRSERRNVLGYDASSVWVDAEDFSALADMVPEHQTLEWSKIMHPQLVGAYELYQDDFLRGYYPNLNGLMKWMDDQRDLFRSKFHRLLEKLIQNEIMFGNHAAALEYAERWHQSSPYANLPLQYLIWLSAHLQMHTRVLEYLKVLAKVETFEPNVIGLTADGWHKLFNRSMKPAFSVLRLDTLARADMNDLKTLAGQHIIGRDEALEHAFDVLFMSKSTSLLTVSGEKGVGKSIFAEAVGLAVNTAGLVENVLSVQLSANADFDELLNGIAKLVGLPMAVELDYRSKYLSVESALSSGTYLLIIDCQEPEITISSEFEAGVKSLSEYTTVIVCVSIPWQGVEDVSLAPIQLPEAIADIFSKYMGENAPHEEIRAHAEQLLTITGGLPLALRLLSNTILSQKVSVAEAVSQIMALSSEQPLLQWCWQFLNVNAQSLLVILLQFDALEGPTRDDFAFIRRELSPAELNFALKQLEKLGLVKLVGSRYTLHALILEFLYLIDARNLPEYAKCKTLFRERFCERQLGYLQENTDDFIALDQHHRNIFRALGYAFEAGSLDVSHVNLFVPYQIARGQFYSARQVLTMAASKLDECSAEVKAELNLYMAKLDIKQGEIEAAESRLIEARDLVGQSQKSWLIASIYEQLGIVAKKSQPIELARLHLKTAEQFARQGDRQDVLCNILANLGNTEMDDQRFDAAHGYLMESLDLVTEATSSRVEQYILTALGVISLEFLDFDEAYNYLLWAQKLASDSGYFERQGYIYLNLGITCFYRKQFDDARMHLQHASEIADRLQHEDLGINLKRSLGRLEAAQHQRMLAEQLFKQALIQSSRSQPTHLSVGLLIDLAKLELQYHNWSDAQRYALQALEQAESLCVDQLMAESAYSLCLVILAQKWVIGPDDTQATVDYLSNSPIADVARRLERSSIKPSQLERAAFFFQFGLDNFPELERFRVTEALIKMLNL